MKKKLIFVSEALWIGGIETALLNLLNRLDYEKFDVTLLLRRAEIDESLKSRLPRQCRLLVCDREDGSYPCSRLYHLTEETDHPSRLHRAMQWAVPAIRWAENRLYIRHVRKKLRGEAFDTCVIYSDVTAETAVRAVKADKYLLFYHHGAMRRAYHDETGWRKADKIITVSEKTLEPLGQFRSRYADKITVLHNLVDISMVREKAKEFAPAFPENAFNIVTCGRLSEEKGIDRAAEACRILLEKGYSDLHWWIVGGGPEEAALRKQIEQAGTSYHFHLLGMQSNPYPYIAAADLYVQPSRYENYSVVILEAMALCKPILATVPAGGAQIRSGENGMLCLPDPEGIAAGIEYLYQNRQERINYTRYLQQHSLEQQNREILDKLYELF